MYFYRLVKIGPRKSRRPIRSGWGNRIRTYEMTESESVALPLGDTPMNIKIVEPVYKPSSVLCGYLSRSDVSDGFKRYFNETYLRATLYKFPNLASNGVYIAVCVTAGTVSSYLAFSTLQTKFAVLFCCTFLKVAFTGISPAFCSVMLGLSSLTVKTAPATAWLTQLLHYNTLFLICHLILPFFINNIKTVMSAGLTPLILEA